MDLAARRLVLLAWVLLPLAVACGDAGVENSVEPTGVMHEVHALDNLFRPEVLEVSVGDEVVFVNRGRTDHDVLPAEGHEWGVTVEGFGPGDEYRHVFTEAGRYRYYCSLHGTADVGMIGSVVVSAPGALGE